MFIIKGKRKIRIKICTDHEHACPHCGNFDLSVGVFAEYYHAFFIPFSPIGEKTIKILCNSCSESFRSDSLQKEYATKMKAPFYLYSGMIIVVCFFLAIIIFVNNADKEKARIVAHPQVGDVYLLKNDSGAAAAYYFIRIARLNDDSIIAYHSNLQYNQSRVQFSQAEYFVADDEMVLTQPQLKAMMKNGMVDAANRGYGSDEGFNRIR
jgi:hypothetical protein